jgi:acetylornithine deacetylase
MPDPPLNQAAALLQEMVRINSVNADLPGADDGEAPLTAFLEDLAGSWGLTTRRLPAGPLNDQLLITCEVADDRPWLLLDSHLDTVSSEGMTIDPFGGEIDGDKLFGRGACDTKGTGAAMLTALHHYADQPGERPNNIAILLSVDEEVAMRGMQWFVEHDLPKLGFWPWGVIIGEPTEFRPVVAHNGCVRWKLTTLGVATHSSVPHEGRSAISAMVKVIDAIESRYAPALQHDHPLTGAPVCTVNMIHGGTAFNIIPDRCAIAIDRRVTPSETAQEVEPALRYMLDELVHVEYELCKEIDHPPLAPESSAAALLPAVQSVLRDMGRSTLAPGAPFATHAAYTAASGLPSLVLGPGSPHKAHTVDEWVSVEAIERGVEMYLGIMRYNPPIV